MKRAALLLLSVFICYAVGLAQEWQELKGEHFLVYFIEDQKFAKEVVDKAEVYYERIAADLGYPRYKEFWLWDARVKIYIYLDHDTYIKATGQPQWSAGMADYKNKQIVSYMWSKGFLESLLPHEIAHLIFRDFVGFKGEIPLWLDEGVAQWEEEAKRPELRARTTEFFNKDGLLLLRDIMKLNLNLLKDMQSVFIRPTRTRDNKDGVLFLSIDSLIDLYYLQSASLVGFLIEKYGPDNFAIFCRQLRDGKSLEEAFRFAYPSYIRNPRELEERWREYLSKEAQGGKG